MIRFSKRCFNLIKDANSKKDLKETFFRSPLSSNSELVKICKEVSDLSSFDLRFYLGKEDFLKTFISTLVSRIPKLENPEMISVVKDLIKNPELRDQKHTFNFWPSICRALNQRLDIFSAEQAADTLHSLCFIRISGSLFEDLVSRLKIRFSEFNEQDFSLMPLSKFPEMLWAMNNKGLDDSFVYEKIFNAFINHKEFEFMSYEQMALVQKLLTVNKYVKNSEALVRSLTESLKTGLEESKIKSFHELINVVYFLDQSGLSSSFYDVINRSILARLQENCSVISLLRLISTNVKLSNEVLVLVKTKIIESLNRVNLIEAVYLYKSDLFYKFPQEKAMILESIKVKQTELNLFQFSRIEKMINVINNSFIEDSKMLFYALEQSLYDICNSKDIPDSFLLRIMKWVLTIGADSKISQLYISKITSKSRLPSYHTRDIMNSIIIACNIKGNNLQPLFEFFNNKVFSISHLFESYEIAVSLFFMSRRNRIGIEIQELLLKRVMEREYSSLEVENYTLTLVAAVLNGNLDFCRKNLPIVKYLMNFQGIEPTNIRLGDVMKRVDLDFNLHIISFIRVLWTLCFMNIKDLRIINSGIFSKIYKFEPKDYVLKNSYSTEERKLDFFHLCIYIQSLVILGSENNECVEYVAKLKAVMDKWALCFDYDCSEINEVEEIAKEFDMKIEKNVPFYGNLLKLIVEDQVVFVYTSEHYKYETEGFYKKKGLQDLWGYFEMRKRMMNVLEKKFLEIEAGEWNELSLEEKKRFVKGIKRLD